MSLLKVSQDMKNIEKYNVMEVRTCLQSQNLLAYERMFYFHATNLASILFKRTRHWLSISSTKRGIQNILGVDFPSSIPRRQQLNAFHDCKHECHDQALRINFESCLPFQFHHMHLDGLSSTTKKNSFIPTLPKVHIGKIKKKKTSTQNWNDCKALLPLS